MITSNVPSSSGSTQATVTSHGQFSSFSNQPSSRYPIPPNLLPYDPLIPAYFPPVQQHVLPPTHPQGYLTTRAHTPSEFPYPPPTNPVQQYSVLPSHTNTPIRHQNPSLSYEQHPLPPLTGGPPHPYHHRLSSQPFPLYSSTDPNSVTTAGATATSHHSLNPPDDVHSLTSRFSSMTTSSTKNPTLLSDFTQATSLSYDQCSSLIPQITQFDSTRHSSNAYHTEQLSHQQSFSPRRSRQSYRGSTTTAYHSLAPPSPPATTPSGVTSSPSTPAHQHPLSPAMQRYVTYLKNVYNNKTTPVYDKEHSLLRVKAKSFINIALVHRHSPQYMNDSDRNEMIMDRLHGHVDAIQRKKTELFICDICKSYFGRLARSVLVEGAPGVGKTTFAYELCKRWARGEILREWAAVVLIKLRDHTTRTAQNMYDLLYHPRPEIQQAVVDELIDHDGKGMLLILDGYDELTDSQKQSTSVIQRIMSKKLLVQATLMVTSRPLATRTLHYNFVQSIDQHIEVLGFTEKNIEEYTQSACGDNPELLEDFKSYLSSHPFSSALMFNPLQCAIVTDLYRSHWEKGDKGFAPKTLTELYTGLVHIMLLRYLTHHPVYKDRYWRIKDLSDLPEEISQPLKTITELAAEGIENQQYVFDEVNTNIPLETLGLMQKEEVVASGIGISTSHNFLHLTLQEYLAAVNYSQQCSSPEQLSELLTRDDLFPLNNFLQYYGRKRVPSLYSSATHWPVVLFVAGRTKLSGVPTNIFKTGLHDSDNDGYITTVDVSLLHILYETQSPQLIQSTLVTSRKYLSVTGISALDWFVIGYCIACSNSVWEVRKEVKTSPKYFEQLFTGLHLGHKQGTTSGNGTIGSVHVGGYWSENLNILSQLQPYAKTVRRIELIEQTQDVTLKETIYSHFRGEFTQPPIIALHSTDVVMHSLDISYSGFNKLVSCINPFTQTLTELILHVDNDTHTCTSGVETVLQEIPSNCPLLETLEIYSDISFPLSIPQFIRLQQNNLHNLSLRCTLSSDVTRSLIHSLQSPHCKLCKLALYDCTIPTADHTQLTTAIVSSTTITHLLFIDKNINALSLTALASGLKHNTTIEQLSVDRYGSYFVEAQFHELTNAVDSSGVQKLWLYGSSRYKKCFSDCTLRNNVAIEWYWNDDDLFNKWRLHGVMR